MYVELTGSRGFLRSSRAARPLTLRGAYSAMICTTAATILAPGARGSEGRGAEAGVVRGRTGYVVVREQDIRYVGFVHIVHLLVVELAHVNGGRRGWG